MRFPWAKKIQVEIEDEEPEITYPRFTYLINWTHGRKRTLLAPNAIHFGRQLTQSQIKDLTRAMSKQSFRCKVTNVTGKPAKVPLSAIGL